MIPMIRGVKFASIPVTDQDRALVTILTRFAKLKNEGDVFDGGREGIQTLLAATSSPAGGTAQDRMLDLLAGTSQPDTSDAHTQLVEDMIRIFEAQRLISLSSIFDLVDQLGSVAARLKPGPNTKQNPHPTKGRLDGAPEHVPITAN